MIFGKMPKAGEDEAPTHPLEPIFAELWPVLKGLFQKYAVREIYTENFPITLPLASEQDSL